MHYRDLRLFNNAGIAFPACRAGDELLDMDCGSWPTSGIKQNVTCPECLILILVSIYGEQQREGIKFLISCGFDYTTSVEKINALRQRPTTRDDLLKIFISKFGEKRRGIIVAVLSTTDDYIEAYRQIRMLIAIQERTTHEQYLPGREPS